MRFLELFCFRCLVRLSLRPARSGKWPHNSAAFDPIRAWQGRANRWTQAAIRRHPQRSRIFSAPGSPMLGNCLEPFGLRRKAWSGWSSGLPKLVEHETCDLTPPEHPGFWPSCRLASPKPGEPFRKPRESPSDSTRPERVELRRPQGGVHREADSRRFPKEPAQKGLWREGVPACRSASSGGR